MESETCCIRVWISDIGGSAIQNLNSVFAISQFLHNRASILRWPNKHYFMLKSKKISIVSHLGRSSWQILICGGNFCDVAAPGKSRLEPVRSKRLISPSKGGMRLIGLLIQSNHSVRKEFSVFVGFVLFSALQGCRFWSTVWSRGSSRDLNIYTHA